MLVEVDGHRIDFARPEKWVWYDVRRTMLDLAKYYVAVYPWMQPYLEHRPVVYEIYKGTVNGPSSFEQDPPPGTPRWIKTARIRGRERLVTYVVVDSAATLVHLVSTFMVTLHVWQSKTGDVERPDFLLMDLDPTEGCTLAQLARAAVRTRDVLQAHGIRYPLVKSSGARGLHVLSFVEPEYDYAALRELARELAGLLAREHPEQFTAERDPHRRPNGVVYVDWGQVGRGMTIVPPYSPRACAGAPVSMPLQWSEVERLTRSRSRRPPIEYFSRYSIANVVELLKKDGDPWQAHRPEKTLLSARQTCRQA